MTLRELHGLDRLRQRADLVHLDEDRVRDAAIDAELQALRVGDEDVVADELDAVAQLLSRRLPAIPVVLGIAVLDRNDRKAVDETREEVGHLLRLRLEPFKAIHAFGEELASRRIVRD